MGGGTYSRKLPVAVGFGPGVPDAVNPFESGHGQGHQPDECVPLKMLLNGLKTYIIALLELDKMMYGRAKKRYEWKAIFESRDL